MAIQKIPCGGFMYDDETITFENGVMKVIGGGSGGGIEVIVNAFPAGSSGYLVKGTYDEILTALQENRVITGYAYDDRDEDDMDAFRYGQIIAARYYYSSDEGRYCVYLTCYNIGGFEVLPDNTIDFHD